ncbi:MAG: hypothetical protein JWP01_3442 [Myxococcales bacterium]|nr:hypothetical protein [Myxococcales bacterium]
MSATDLYFEKHLFVRLVLDKRQGPIRVNVGGAHQLEVLIRPLTTDEQTPERHEAVSCITKGVWPFKGSALSSLRNVSQDLMPDGKDPSDAWAEFMRGIYAEPFKPGSNKMRTMMDLYPQGLRDSLGEIRDELETAALTVVALVRWRMDARGGHDPVREDRGVRFSFDGTNWWRLPDPSHEMESWSETHAVIDAQIHAELEQYTARNLSQPLGHELLREAFSTRSKNPRSALIVTMTALEVGVKEYIADLVPDAEWLAFEAPSPNVVKMLGEYLPKIPSRAASGVLNPPPKKVLETLKVAVTLRNTVAHQGKGNISIGRLSEIMATVADVLRVLDVHRGFPWSLKYVRDEVRKEWFGESV